MRNWRPRASGLWVFPQELQYARLNEDLAVLRLTAALEGRMRPPAGVALLVERPDGTLRYPALGSVTNDRVRRRASDELLWRVTFCAPLHVLRHPDAAFELTAEELTVALPPATACTIAALSHPWDQPVHHQLVPVFVGWRRRLVAFGTTVAVIGANTAVPASIAAANSAPGPQAKPNLAAGTCCPRCDPQPATTEATGVSSCSPQPDPTPVPAAPSVPSTPAAPSTPSAPADQNSISTPASGGAGLPGGPPPATAQAPTQSGGPSSQSSASVGTSSATPAPRPVHQARPDHAHGHRRRQRPHPTVFRSSGGAGLSSIAPAPPVPMPTAPVSQPDTDDSTPTSPTGSPVTSSGSAPGIPSGADSNSTAVIQQLSGLFASVNQPPAFLIPIYKRAGKRFHVPWQVLAAINSIETNYGRDLSVSSAGAIGWMQFMPETWSEYAISAKGHGKPNPYDPADAIFTAAKYLEANGVRHDLRRAIFAYNHATWYVDAVLWRASMIRDRHGHTGLTNPFFMGWRPSRLDMGYDGTFSEIIVAPFSGTITYAADSFSNWGGYLNLRADHPIKGLPTDTLYFAEGVRPLVATGRHVGIGQPILAGVPSPWNGITGNIEWGVAQTGVVGTPSDPYAKTLGLGSAGARLMVLKFAAWAAETLGVAPPATIDNAGSA